jgi:hypothetical protein
MRKKTLALLISAYKADENLINIVDKFLNQKLPRGWDVKIYIGVDGCKDTFNLLKENKINFYYSSNNVGTYIICNSLINIAKKYNHDMYARFDADDIPTTNFLFYGIKRCLKLNFVRTYFQWENHPTKSRKEKKLAYGVIFFDNEVLSKVGGFSRYRVEGDHDFVMRLKNLGYLGNFRNIIFMKLYKKPIFKRIHNPTSLTGNKKTAQGSSYRNSIKQQLEKDRKVGSRIIPKVVNLELIKNN